MSTIKSRLNISLSDDTKKVLLNVAKRDQMPTATKAARLIEIGLETEEDEAWDKIATKRDQKGSKFYSHSETFET
jgi:predicted DNA-binding protein